MLNGILVKLNLIMVIINIKCSVLGRLPRFGVPRCFTRNTILDVFINTVL